MTQAKPQMEHDDKKYIWHPFTQMKDWVDSTPLVIDQGEGSYLIDVDGNRYLDGVSSLWVTVHGHCREELNRAISEQVAKLSHSTLLGLTHPTAINLARRLVGITPKRLQKVFYSDNGSTAVEISLKMAYQYWQLKGEIQREKFIGFHNAYHGDTIGSVSVGGIDLFHSVYRPLLFDSIKAPSPYCYRCELHRTYPECELACLGALETLMEAHAPETAALIIEPLVQAAGGMIMFPDGFLKGVQDLCRKHGVLMITDEVATGFGRTGRMFACEHEGVEPDLMAVAKGITGGYLPLAATLTSDDVYDAFCGKFEEQKTFFHGHTYTGNPVACAAALANLDIFEKDHTIDAMQPKITFLSAKLAQFQELGHVGEVRQKGFMVGIELVADKKTKEPFAAGDKVGQKVTLNARKRGLIIRPLGDVIVLMPPLSVSLEELGQVVDITYESIVSVTEGR